MTAIPKPYQKPYPKLWVSAQSEKGIKAAGTKGYNMMSSPNLGCFAPHGDLDRAMSWYNEAADAAGVARGEVMLLRRVYIDEDEKLALRQLDNVYNHWNYYMAGFAAANSSEADRFSERAENEGYVKGGAVNPAKMHIERDDIYNTYDDPILTNPERAIARFKYYESLGVNHIAALTAFGGTVDEVIHSMEVMAKYVFPTFADDEPVLEPEQK